MKRHIKGETFASVVHAYLHSTKFSSLAWSTQRHYSYLLTLAQLPETMGLYPVEQIRPALIQGFLDGLADRPGQQRNAKVALGALERWAVVRDLMPYPFMTGTEVIGDSGEGHEPWTDEQVRLAETYSRPHISRLVTLASNTGQRGSDLVTMRWNDIEEYEGRLGINVTQHKTGLRLWVPFTAELARAIQTWERRPTFLALKEDGQPWRRSQLSDAWRRERDNVPELAPLKEAGLVMHGLRATAVVRLRRAGATTGQIKDMVGLSEPMVNRYCRLSVQRDNAMAAVRHLDRTGTEQGQIVPFRTKA